MSRAANLDSNRFTPLSIDVKRERRALRAEIRALRRNFQGAQRASATDALNRRLLERLALIEPGCIGLYRAFDGEVDVEPAARSLQDSGWTVLFGRQIDDGALAVVDAERWQTTPAGLPCPIGQARPPSVCSVLLVPGVAFGADGARLGLGGGCYDRALATFTGLTIGVCFEFQRVPTLVTASWDQPVHQLVTDQTTEDYSTPETNP